jgi:predicted nucleic acid-binding protein
VIVPDSSVLIAALAPWHASHLCARDALVKGDVRLIAHVAFETTSALSRMPEGHRISPTLVLDALNRGFRQPWLSLNAADLRRALSRAVETGVRGGALHDALIAATAAKHHADLVSADRRACATYETMGVQARFIDT